MSKFSSVLTDLPQKRPCLGRYCGTFQRFRNFGGGDCSGEHFCKLCLQLQTCLFMLFICCLHVYLFIVLPDCFLFHCASRWSHRRKRTPDGPTTRRHQLICIIFGGLLAALEIQTTRGHRNLFVSLREIPEIPLK